MKTERLGRRFLAFLLDYSIVGIISYIICNLLVFIGLSDFAYFMGISYILFLFYFSLQESSSYQATIGKRLLKLVVCSSNGEPLTMRKAFFRNFIRIINFFIYSVGYITILFTKKEQGIHDLLAGTIVIDEDGYFED